VVFIESLRFDIPALSKSEVASIRSEQVDVDSLRKDKNRVRANSGQDRKLNSL
jgi:hypothetical protein